MKKRVGKQAGQFRRRLKKVRDTFAMHWAFNSVSTWCGAPIQRHSYNITGIEENVTCKRCKNFLKERGLARRTMYGPRFV